MTRVLFVHGRAQGGKNAAALKQEWIDTLKRGFAATSLPFPTNVQFDFPFYGDVLDQLAAQAGLPSPGDVLQKGAGQDTQFEQFMQAALDEIQQAEVQKTDPRLTPAEVEAEMDDPSVGEKGIQNWGWVQALARAIDRRWTGAADFTIETFLKDVFLYVNKRAVTKKINQVVESELTSEPTIVVSHSLGTVVAYKVIQDNQATLKLVKHVTVGSPLGIKAISSKLGVPENLAAQGWFNAYDDGDIVALNPLNQDYFPTTPPIVNDGGVVNRTPNQHGIIGYLDHARVAREIAAALA